jgi:hypothetical protein
MKEIIGVYLKRIERDAKGLPIKLYPFTRDTESDMTPRSDPPHLIADRQRAGISGSVARWMDRCGRRVLKDKL